MQLSRLTPAERAHAARARAALRSDDDPLLPPPRRRPSLVWLLAFLLAGVLLGYLGSSHLSPPSPPPPPPPPPSSHCALSAADCSATRCCANPDEHCLQSLNAATATYDATCRFSNSTLTPLGLDAPFATCVYQSPKIPCQYVALDSLMRRRHQPPLSPASRAHAFAPFAHTKRH